MSDPEAKDIHLDFNVNEPLDLWLYPLSIAVPRRVQISNGNTEPVLITYNGAGGKQEILLPPGGEITVEPVDVLDEFGKAVEDVMRKEPEVPPAQRAYEAYCESAGGVSLVGGQRLPELGKLKPEIQAAWAAAVAEVIRKEQP